MNAHVLLLPGDGIGPEVTDAARRCLEAVARHEDITLTFDTAAFGGGAIDTAGIPLPADTLAKARDADAILLGAVGGSRWDGASVRPEKGLLDLRSALGLFANLRPVRVIPGLEPLSPLKAEHVCGADILIVRELIGGLYFGEKRESATHAFDGCAYSRFEIERIAAIAFHAARGRKGRVTSVDKANVLATSKLWRRTVTDLASLDADVRLNHLYVDAAAMELVTRPTQFDVILTENLFGDILSDEAAVLTGSIGLLASASLGATGPGVFEPIHGSAPDIAGTDRANPGGAIASAALLLRFGLGQHRAALRLERALEEALQSGHRTADLGGTLSCSAFTEAVLKVIDASPS